MRFIQKFIALYELKIQNLLIIIEVIYNFK